MMAEGAPKGGEAEQVSQGRSPASTAQFHSPGIGAQPELTFLESTSPTVEPGSSGVGVVPQDLDGMSLWGRVTSVVAWLKQSKTRTLKNIRPWGEFIVRSKFSSPKKTEVWQRVTINLKYYNSNYLVLVLILAAWTAVSNLFFVLSMGFAALAYSYWKSVTKDGEPFLFRGKQVSSLQFHAGFIGMTLLLFYLSGGSSVVFWLIVSVAGTIGTHAVMREPIDQLQLVSMALEEATDTSLQDTYSSAFGSAV